MATAPTTDSTWPAERHGVAAIVVRRGQLLLGKRLGAHGAGTWALPGGKPNVGESDLACAVRELFEETGIAGRAVAVVGESRAVFEGNQSWHTSVVLVDAPTGPAVRREPTKNAGWIWADPTRLPTPLFPPFANFVANGGLARALAQVAKS
jgi:8-oxo-dGTP diphosphatase